jgi:hypothetical protein
MKTRAAAIAVVFATCGVASAADRPSGLEVWLTCRNDVKVTCPNTGLFNLSALKRCMKDNFSHLGPRCQSVVVRYQNGQPELASRSDPPR